MRSILTDCIERIQKSHRDYRRYVVVLLVLAALTTLGVNWWLHRNGISMTADYTCGQVEHQHDSSCYTKVLTCGLEEGAAGHTHTEDCYETTTTLVCQETEHTHGEGCYDADGNLICQEPEHVHAGDCYTTETVLICGQEESQAHTHTDACYEEQLTCETPEHTHTALCMADSTADVETASTWEATLPKSEELTGVWADDLIAVAKSQLGYTESTKNYILSEDGSDLKGYTRYGAWYGNEYGDWCAMFAAFCLHYAGIPTDSVPVNSGCQAWIVQLKDEKVDLYRDAESYTPAPGDLIFFDWNQDGTSDHVGIVTQLVHEDENDDTTPVVSIKTIEGNTADKVAERKYDLTDATILGYCQLPENPALHPEETPEETPAQETTVVTDEATGTTSQTAVTENYTVTVTYGPEAQLPENAILQVTEYGPETEEYQNACAETGETYDWLLDISFYADGEEIEPQAEVSISVLANDSSAADEDATTQITHFAEDGTEVIENEDVEVADTEDGQTEFSFSLPSLSLVGGTTYHTATVVQESSFSWNNDYLIYKVSGNYVYFVANSGGEAVTFRVALSDVSKKEGSGATADNMTALNSVSYFKDSLAGTIFDSNGSSYSATLNWSNLVWHHNGADRGSDGSLQNTTTTNNQYLKISNGSISMSWWQDVYAAQGSDSKYTVFSEKQTTYILLLPVTNTYYLVFNGTRFTGSTSSSGGDLTLAKVGDDHEEKKDTGTGTGKTAVYTGTITNLPLGFYSVTPGTGDSKIEGLAGVTYTIYKADGSIAGLVTTTSDMRVDISSLGLQNGSYTMKMTNVPSGYHCDDSTWTFTISSNSKTLSLKNSNTDELEGIIVVNPEGNLDMDKTASVSDYENRVYQVDLEAKSNIVKAAIKDLSIDFVVDQSNSMLFPSGLKEVGNYFSVKKTSYEYTGDDNKQHTGYTYTGTVDWQNHLDVKKLYYVITQEDTSSTVWALWYDGVWKVQDASYYAKAYYGTNQPDKIITSNVVSYPTSKTYDGSAGCAGAALYSDNNLDGSGFKSDLNKAADGTTKTYMVYEAVDEYNRLHYLEQSLSDLLQMLAVMCPEAEVTLDCFVNSIKSCNTYTLGQDYNGTSGLQKLLDLVGAINTDGGTRQDIALQHAYETHQKNNTKTNKYLVLITDGAPATSSSSKVTLGSATDTIPSAIVEGTDGTTVYENINYWANQIKDKGTTLATVGLSMQNVKEGSKSMRFIATNGPSTTATVSGDHGDWWFQPQNSSELMEILCNKILNQIVNVSEVDPDYGTVIDYITDSFYPVNPETQQAVESGTRIDAQGNVVSSGQGIGTILQADDGSWYVRWDKTRVTGSETTTSTEITGYTTETTTTWKKGDTSKRYTGSWWNQKEVTSYTENGLTYTWQEHDGVTAYWASETTTTQVPVYGTITTDYSFKGRVYLKAKEDFIGGNAINTNKKATLTLDSGGTYDFNRPTVNVRLLELNGNTSQVTVYKGDTISSPETAVDTLYDTNVFKKLVSGTDDVHNKVGASQADPAVGDSDFSIKYAIGRDLTEDEWTQLKNGQAVTIQYTYDEAEGTVGYFTLKLEEVKTESGTTDYGKESVEGQTAGWADHEATTAKGAPNGDNLDGPYGSNWIEKYTLNVTYTAYKLGENDRPNANQYNGEAGPGTEVDPAITTGLPNGQGTETVQDIHYVYAIDGQIVITKKLAADMKSDKDQTFTFKVTKDGEDFGTFKVTVKAGETSAAIEPEQLKHLPRGTYVISEVIGEEDKYAVEGVEVTDNNTDTYYTSNTNTATIKLGYNRQEKDVVQGGTYSSGGVYGAAAVTNTSTVTMLNIPVEKVWQDAKGNPVDGPETTIYVVLLSKNADGSVGTPILVDEKAQVVALNSQNSWKGTFAITVTKDYAKNPDIAKDYAIGEFSKLKDAPGDGIYSFLENDVTKYFAWSDVTTAAGDAYIDQVRYAVSFSNSTDSTGTTLQVINKSYEYELPNAGGAGTYLYTAGGIALMGGVLMCGLSLRRRREGRVE